MTTFLLFLHVAAAVLLIGPVTVAVSAFPKAAQNAQSGSEEAVGRASFLHSMSTKYGLISLLVPLLGGGLLAFDWETHKSNYWMHTAIVLSVLAWVFLFAMVIPQQRKMMGSLGALHPADADPRDIATDFDSARVKAAAGGGIFCLLWFVTLILMFLPAPA
ncbi:hypothetical protein SAMN05444817_11820 [Corynebacterium appendicis CIP 107643]|uniref:DUF2269 domain-containing protein n=1 Tax=Corynebacterium appendicis CIP 107643 TaxID=1161099 RepID=A0A1N7KDM2_9CORY|nr:DUF2269 domain-containing protein [Corynebacterium appendicis]MDK8626516.1 DUF2269 domain-containing protein [Corynebacterium appendicis]WJY60853.1 hypothetical protein CAPP_04635 [Corynebacterium appendicis CIP 107643]SIS59649.1 hypothetical protein SAMN05444817_11820 [Corynebacterium appendicis CIP 107643]